MEMDVGGRGWWYLRDRDKGGKRGTDGTAGVTGGGR